MSDVPSAEAPAPASTPPRKRWKFWGPRPDGRPRLLWAERWNSLIYATFIAVGVPLMSVFIANIWHKWVVVAVWFGLAAPMYMFLEGREIRGQMTGRGAIDTLQATKQIRTGQFPYWGAIVALIVWIIGLVAFVVGNWPQAGWWDTIVFLWWSFGNNPVQYGLIEWLILAHTVYIARISTVTFDGIISEFLKATPRSERTERRLPNG